MEFEKIRKHKREFVAYAQRVSEWIHNNYFKKPGKILDVGCVRGEYLLGFKEKGYEVFGIENDKEYVKKKLVPNIIQHDANKKLPFKDNSFDYVLSKNSIEHLRYPEILLQEIHRILKKGGLTFIMTDEWKNKFKEFYDDPTHKTPFSSKGLKKLLESMNYKIRLIKGFHHPPYIWKYSSKIFRIVRPFPLRFFILAEKTH